MSESPKIKDCFWLNKGKCTSPEIYRFRLESLGIYYCDCNPEDTAIINCELRCLEFRPNRKGSAWRGRG